MAARTTLVELIARAALPAGASVGDRLRYDVVRVEAVREDFELDGGVDQLLRTPESVVVRTRDAFGHVYTADVLRDLRGATPELRRLRGGSLVQHPGARCFCRPPVLRR